MPEFFNTLLQKLAGFDFWFAVILFVIGLAGWHYLGQTEREERKTARRQLWFVGALLSIAAVGIGAHHLFFDSDFTFPKDVAGILVLRIEGDDENGSLQRLLVSSLNNSIRKEVTGQKIEIRAHNEAVSEAMGLAQAHTKAREIGKAGKAILVIWGNRVGDNTFFPRVTVVERKQSSTSGQWTLAAEDISKLDHLPTAQVDRPIYLKHFVTGYAFYDRDNYAAALAEFKAALNQSVINPVELNEIRVFCGYSHAALSRGQRDMASQLHHAIAYYDTALSFYTEKDFPEQWAKAQRSLGNAYINLRTGERSVNLKKSISCYEAALRVYTEKESPEEWASIQNNLGVAYRGLPIGDENENQQKGRDFYQTALRASSNEKDSPDLWALIHRNLGGTKSGDSDKHLQKAITLYDVALRTYAEKDFPMMWAFIQNELGHAYSDLEIGDRIQNFKKAIAFYEAALRVYTEEAFPVYWADTQKYLGDVYSDSLMVANDKENLQKAIAYYQAALRVYNEKDFPEDWARTQKNLGEAYAKGLTNANAYAGIVSALLTGTRGDTNLSINLPKAIAAYEAALRVYTEKDYPKKWAEIQSMLGVAYWFLPTGDRNANRQRAIAASEAALRVYTEKDSPNDWAKTQIILGVGYVFTAIAAEDEVSLKKANAASEAALRVYTEKDSPEDWALSQYLLGYTYMLLAAVTNDTTAYAKKAIAVFEAALRVFTEKNYPVQWAGAQFCLGGIYMELSPGSRTYNLQRAIAYFENALRVKAIPEFHQEVIDILEKAQSELRGLEKK